jgi:ABC-type branched-subunit amino acid transport system ATPase component
MAETGRRLDIVDAVAGYGEGTVLDGLSLTVEAGEAIALVGRNGAGKTTLLRLIMGLLPLRAGALRYGGASLAGMPTFAIARLGIGYVPQGREIFAELTVEENLRLGNLAAPDAEAAFKLFPSLAGRHAEPAGALSGGQQQQLAIARALMGRPGLLLLDEPSEGIQPSVVAEITAALTAVAARTGMGLVLVEQDMDMALQLATRFVFIETGRIVATHLRHEVVADAGLLERHLAL